MCEQHLSKLTLNNRLEIVFVLGHHRRNNAFQDISVQVLFG